MAMLIDEPIITRTYINADRERVFRTLTTGAGWDAWFTRGTELDARPGGEILFRWEEFGPDVVSAVDNGTVQEINFPDLFVFTWHPVDKEHPILVRIELAEAHGGTMVRLISTEFPDTARGRKMLLDCAVGWGEALTLLKFYLEYGVVYTVPVVHRQDAVEQG